MQFPVPQFTDVEDRIIGPLTIKQFGIVFGAGVVIFLGYSATKSILVAIFLFVLFGLPAITLAFAKINGRPIYNSIGYFVNFFLSPKILVFHKQAMTQKQANDQKSQNTVVKEATSPMVTPADTKENLRKVQQLLRETQGKEEEMLKNRNSSS
ncbi:MAG: PrgI family protein [Patescibacteria group bacterium]